MYYYGPGETWKLVNELARLSAQGKGEVMTLHDPETEEIVGYLLTPRGYKELTEKKNDD